MPRTARSKEEITAFKESILNAALDIIVRDGFSRLSMRKLAAKLGITATALYNYFQNKEELYFYIRIRGFELLHQRFQNALAVSKKPFEKIRTCIREYLRFGREYPDYYEVMFVSRNVPKFLDCIGTPLEKVARREKETALRPFLLITREIVAHAKVDIRNARYFSIRLWTELNGIVTLLNSRLLREVEEDTEKLVERLSKDIAGRLKKYM